jgi:class 3 adenylate cyclase/YHS domain-containing protein
MLGIPRGDAAVTSTEHTFLFADLAGFTALTEAHGDERAADLAETFRDAVLPLLSGHRGALVKMIGDALMIRCEEPADAIRLGLGIVEVGGGHGFPTVRGGLHSGAAVARGADWFGATVNLAARVSALAAGEEVLVSEATDRPDIVIDPVCRMAIEPGNGAGCLEHEGVRYHFCSLDCAARFAARPDSYVGLGDDARRRR